jgi:hypothetical protein
VNLAESWLGGPLSIFWETAAIVVLTLALVFLGILTLRTIVARKSLNCSIISRTRLLDAPKSMHGKLQVVFEDAPPLTDPYMTVVEIANTGKTSIASSLFDNDRSMKFNLGTDVIEVLSVERTPESSPLPKVVSSESFIELRPELISAGEVIRASVLTSGRVQDIKLALNPLSENYKISMRDREVWQRQQARRLKLAGLTMAVLIVVEIVGLLLLATHALNTTTTALNTQISLTKNDACEGVDESALNLSSTTIDDVGYVLALFKADDNRPITLNPTFSADAAYLNVQINDFSSNTAEAAALGVNMKESNPTVQKANRFLADFEKLPKGKTFPEQEADLSQAETVSLSVLSGVSGVMSVCRSYAP